ncbi:MAG: hypothetical protein Q9162_007417 [Coniocarpon cinnabarinum]
MPKLPPAPAPQRISSPSSEAARLTIENIEAVPIDDSLESSSPSQPGLLQRPHLLERAKTTSTLLSPSANKVSEYRHRFEDLEKQAVRGIRSESGRLRHQIDEARKKISSLETEVRRLNRDVEESNEHQDVLRSDYRLIKQDLASKSEELRITKGELLRARSQAQIDVGWYESMIDELKSKNDSAELRVQKLEEQLREEEKSSAILSIRAGSPVSISLHSDGEDVENRLHQAHETRSWPRRPKYDPKQEGNVSEETFGGYLYDSPRDQWHESMIKRLLLRAQIARFAKKPQRSLELTLVAGQHAFILNNMPLLARCGYHRGRAELALQHYEQAVLSFEEAQAARGRYSEGDRCRKHLQKAKFKYTQELRMKGVLEDVNHSVIGRQPLLNVNGVDMLQFETSRWMSDPDQRFPSFQIMAKASTQTRGSQFQEPSEAGSHHSRRGSSAPPSPQAKRLSLEDESVLLRPFGAPDDGYQSYYNAIIPRQPRKKGHKRNYSSLSDISRASSIEDSISDAANDDVVTVSNKYSKEFFSKDAPVVSSQLEVPDLSSLNLKRHRKRPSQLDIGSISNAPRTATMIEKWLSDHYQTSDADDPLETAKCTLPSRTPKTAMKVVEQETAQDPPNTGDPISQRTKLHRPSEVQKVVDDTTAHVLTSACSPGASNSSPALMRLTIPQRSPVNQDAAGTPASPVLSMDGSLADVETISPAVPPFHGPVNVESSKAAKVLDIKTDAFNITHDLKQPDSSYGLQRQVSFAKSPTKRRKASTKRASFDPPWTPSPRSNGSPSAGWRPAKISSPPKGYSSQRNDSGDTPPETPRYSMVRQPTGEWRMQSEQKTPLSGRPPNLDTDLETELSDMGESLSPRSAAEGFSPDPSVDVSSPITESFDDAVSTALEPAEVPNSLKPRSPRVSKPRGIDTVLANTESSGVRIQTKAAGKSTAQSRQSTSAPDEQPPIETERSPHVKFAGEQAGMAPTLERRVSSTLERRMSSAEAAYTPKVSSSQNPTFTDQTDFH